MSSKKSSQRTTPATQHALNHDKPDNRSDTPVRKSLWGNAVLILGFLGLIIGLGLLSQSQSHSPTPTPSATDTPARASRPTASSDTDSPTKPPAAIANTATPAPGQRGGPAPGPAPEGMVWIPGGTFLRGDEEFPDANPVRPVTVDGFWLDRTEVTNAQFLAFVTATGYKTVAELPPSAKDFPNADPALLVPGSIVFTPPDHAVDKTNHLQWWRYVPGACWKHPEGPQSSIQGRENHPAVHICWDDAMAYCRWANKRLPTEAEWEFAARGGLNAKKFVWGDVLHTPGTPWKANIFQGTFPFDNTAQDGHPRTSPAGAFAPNGFGLSDMAGNVWEWCSDWYRPDTYESSPSVNPTGPASSFDPQEPGLPKRVQRGGSFLCTDQYCTRYRPGSRGKGEVLSAASHIGFRCALTPVTPTPAPNPNPKPAPADKGEATAKPDAKPVAKPDAKPANDTNASASAPPRGADAAGY